MKPLNLTGQRLGRLVVLGYAEKRGTQRCCRVRCDCGMEKVVRQNKLRNGVTQSCGCYRRERSRTLLKQLKARGPQTHKVKHGDLKGKNKTYLYRTWEGMKRRCFNSHEIGYPYYGGRGITVCPEWRDDYAAFRDYMLANHGERPAGHSIDRINNDGHYEPGNVRWATQSQQTLNQRHSKRAA